MKSVVLIAADVMMLAGCNTINGLGKDIHKAGTSIEDASKKK